MRMSDSIWVKIPTIVMPENDEQERLDFLGNRITELESKLAESEKELAYFKDIYHSLIDGAARDTEKINKLQSENEKLKECLEFYSVRGLTYSKVGQKIDEKLCHDFYVSGGYARQVLRELAVDQLCEKNGW